MAAIAGLNASISQAFQGGVPFKNLTWGFRWLRCHDPPARLRGMTFEPESNPFELEGFNTPTVHDLKAIHESLNQLTTNSTSGLSRGTSERSTGQLSARTGSRRIGLYLLTHCQTGEKELTTEGTEKSSRGDGTRRKP